MNIPEKIKELKSINESHRKLNGELRERIKELEDEVKEYDTIFEMTYAADVRGINMYRAAHPESKRYIPSQDKMILWLIEKIDELEYKISCIQLTITDTDTIEWLDGEGNKKVFHSEETALTKEEAGFIVEYFGVTDSASDFYLNSIPFYTQVIAKLQKIAGK